MSLANPYGSVVGAVKVMNDTRENDFTKLLPPAA